MQVAHLFRGEGRSRALAIYSLSKIDLVRFPNDA